MKDRCFPDTLQGQMTTEWSVLENSWIRAIGENCGIQAVLRKLDRCFVNPLSA